MTSPFDLTGQAALVTGANTGLGQAIAVGLAEAGCDIVAVGRTAPDETAELVAKTGRKLHAISADLGSTAPIGGVVDAAYAAAGRLDILVNNAGIIRRADSLDFTEEDWDAVMDTNLKSVFFLSQAFAKQVLAGGEAASGSAPLHRQPVPSRRHPRAATASERPSASTKILANE